MISETIQCRHCKNETLQKHDIPIKNLQGWITAWTAEAECLNCGYAYIETDQGKTEFLGGQRLGHTHYGG